LLLERKWRERDDVYFIITVRSTGEYVVCVCLGVREMMCKDVNKRFVTSGFCLSESPHFFKFPNAICVYDWSVPLHTICRRYVAISTMVLTF
jgi:hypothetical protein